VYTSGHEGPWTATPFQWSNLYFKNLLRFNWTLTQSPAGHWQFNTSDPAAPPGIMMLVSDIAFIKHDMFRVHVEEFARNASALDYEFARAWYRLASRDMGPASRCIGPFVPPAQPWQRALPPAPPPEEQPDWAGVKAQVAAAMRPETPPSPPALLADGDTNGASYYGAAFVKLAWQCAATFRRTDYQGGCNGARVRMEPQRSWRVNAGLEQVLEVLQPVKNEFPSLSWSDLIVFAAHVAIEEAAAAAGAPPPAPFCPGRTDAFANEEPNDSLQARRAAVPSRPAPSPPCSP
jgi:catalase-peroxidase